MHKACVKPCRAASCKPCSTAAPLPWLVPSTNTCKPSSWAAISCNSAVVPSVLPSTTTHTGFHWARASRTVSNTLRPGL
jgi:hypothetical protein